LDAILQAQVSLRHGRHHSRGLQPGTVSFLSVFANTIAYFAFPPSYISQDGSCIAVASESGYTIYNSDPFKETFRRDFPEGGLGIVEMLFRCNILALVGGGRTPRFPPNKVLLWDDHQNRCLGELSFRSDVKAVKLRRDRVVVALQRKVYVYNFADLKLVDQLETADNPQGLIAVSPSALNSVIACPGPQQGQVHVELYDAKRTTWIAAHDGPLAALALSIDGRLLATASDKGTLLRVFDTGTGQMLHEFRRGSDRAVISSIVFSPPHDGSIRWLACSSDKGTIHIFSLAAAASSAAPAEAAAGTAPQNKRSKLSFLKPLVPKYFGSQWSFAQFRVPDKNTQLAFGSAPESLVIVSPEGNYYRCSWGPAGGEAHQDTFAHLRPE
jgi:WD40 repeat protein